MDSSFLFETTNLRLSIEYIEGSQAIISKSNIACSSELRKLYPDEMPRYRLELRWFPDYSLV